MGLGGESLLLVGVCVRVLPPYSLFNELTLTLCDAPVIMARSTRP